MGDLAGAVEGITTRKHERTRIQIPAKLHRGHDALPGCATLVDVAAGGVGVVASQFAPVDSRVRLQFRMLANRLCIAEGAVVWHQGETRFGVEFRQLNDEMELFVRRIARLPAHLRLVYLADVVAPEFSLSPPTCP